MQKTIVWVDNLKAICIFLVVYGHFADISPFLKNAIYSFHLPAFLLISGYLALSNLQATNPLAAMKNQLIYFLVLYGLFSLAACLIWYLLEARHLPITEIFKPITGSLFGVHGPLLELVHNNDPLWYFPFLISSLLFTFLIIYFFTDAKTLFPILLVVAFAASYLPPLAWSLDLAPLGALFILSGAAFRIFENYQKDNWAKLSSPALILGSACLWVFLVWLNGRVNMNSRDWGSSWWIFLGAAFVGSYCLMVICQKLPATELAKSLSRHTLIIFCTHIYFVKALNPALQTLPEDLKQLAIFGAAILVTLICWAISLASQPLLVHWLKPRASSQLVLSKRS
jgi:fucose 4-O-acetylase-like acetyltransferase